MRASQELSGLRVLVVEDEAVIAFLFEELLQGFGCAVIGVAGSVKRGLKIAEDSSVAIDGAILDISLSGEMSYPIASQLTDRDVPFVFCTAFGRSGVAPHFAHVPVLTKPFLPGDLERLLVSTFTKGRASQGAGASKTPTKPSSTSVATFGKLLPLIRPASNPPERELLYRRSSLGAVGMGPRSR